MSGDLRVLVITNMYPFPGHPYAGIFVHDQVKSLKSLGVEVDVFFINGFRDKKNYLWAPFRLYRILKRKRYDILHVHHSYPLLITWVVRLFTERKVPLIFTFHEPEFLKPREFNPTKGGFLGRLIISGKLKKFALDRADYVIPVWAGLVESLGYRKPYTVIPCGVDLQKFKPIPREEARKKIGWPLGEKILFFPGDRRRRREKGTDLIEEAVGILEKKGLKLRVEYAENIPHDEMPLFMAAADVIVHPSRFEASPMVIKEALGVGTPLVTTTVGDVGEIAAGVDVVLFVGFDPVEIAEKIEVALEMGRSTEGTRRLRALGLSEEEVARRIIRVYRSFYGRRKREEKEGESRESKRVAVIRCGYFPEDPRVYKEVTALLELGLGVDVFCLNQGNEPRFESSGRLRVFRMNRQHRRDSLLGYLVEYLSFLMWAMLKVSKRHLEERFLAVQINTLPDFLVFAALITKFLGSKVVLDMHELVPELFIAEYQGALRSFLFRALVLVEKASIGFADRVICPGPSYLQVFVSRGAPVEKFTLIYNVPSEEIFRPVENAKKEPFLVIAHGTVIERYGFHVIAKSVPRILQEVPEATFEIVGDGEYMPFVKELVKKENVEERIRFWGHLPLSEVPRILSRATVGVVATMKNEFTSHISPNKVFELAALKIPIVASDLHGVRSQFKDSVLYFRPGDPNDLAEKVVEMLRSDVLQRTLGEKAHGIYQQVRWNRNKRDYQRIFQGFISPKH